MLATIKQNKFLRFLITASFIYLVLYLLYQFFIKKYTFLDEAFIRIIIHSADVILQTMGYDTFTVLDNTDFQTIGIDGANGVWIGSACNSITLFFLFAVFVIAYPGHQQSKWWFVLIGILSIHILNLLRVVALAIIQLNSPEWLGFNHTYTFTIIIYGYIFLLWMIWVNKYSAKEHAEK